MIAEAPTGKTVDDLSQDFQHLFMKPKYVITAREKDMQLHNAPSLQRTKRKD
jgi:hypothetical protein